MAVIELESPPTAAPRRGGTRPGRRARYDRIGLLTPSGILLLGGFLLPLVIMLWRAFADPTPGLSNFTWYLGDAVQRAVLMRAFSTALEVTVVCLVLGFPYAYGMVAAGPRLRAALTLLVL